ncbi:hypothetical protein GCM10027615_41970 [Plantactinospora veratri]
MKAIQSTTASNSRRPSADRTESGSRMSARSAVTPAGSGRRVVVPRLSTVNSMPCSTANREQAELMIPLPPTKRTLRALMPPPPVLTADSPERCRTGRPGTRVGLAARKAVSMAAPGAGHNARSHARREFGQAQSNR